MTKYGDPRYPQILSTHQLDQLPDQRGTIPGHTAEERERKLTESGFHIPPAETRSEDELNTDLDPTVAAMLRKSLEKGPGNGR